MFVIQIQARWGSQWCQCRAILDRNRQRFHRHGNAIHRDTISRLAEIELRDAIPFVPFGVNHLDKGGWFADCANVQAGPQRPAPSGHIATCQTDGEADPGESPCQTFPSEMHG